MRSVADSAESVDEESVRRLVLRSLSALVAFVLAAGIALAVSRADSAGDDDPGLASTNEALVGTGTGPLDGTDVATYTDGRGRALAEAQGRWVAVISLRDYVTEQDYTRIYGSFSPRAALVATAGGESDVVTGNLASWTTTAKSEAEEERTQLQSMAATTDDKSFKDQFNADIARLDKLLANLDAAKPIVFGFVTTASANELRALAGRPEVRLVDIVGRRDPSASALARVRGLRPEETVRAGQPRTRPV